MKRVAGVLLVALAQGLVGCGGPSSPSAPSAPPPVTSAPTPVPPPPSPVPLPRAFHVSFSADAACTELPAVVRTRAYSATIGGDGLIDLGGATFGGDGSYLWHTIYATFAGGGAHLYFQDPPIWEQLTGNQYVVIYGVEAAGSVAELPATMSFSGFFTFCADAELDSYPECGVPEIVCKSNDHQLTITR